nr:MAG TPA: PrgI family protein [Caudoviricetes sp.]
MNSTKLKIIFGQYNNVVLADVISVPQDISKIESFINKGYTIKQHIYNVMTCAVLCINPKIESYTMCFAFSSESVASEAISAWSEIISLYNHTYIDEAVLPKTNWRVAE